MALGTAHLSRLNKPPLAHTHTGSNSLAPPSALVARSTRQTPTVISANIRSTWRLFEADSDGMPDWFPWHGGDYAKPRLVTHSVSAFTLLSLREWHWQGPQRPLRRASLKGRFPLETEWDFRLKGRRGFPFVFPPAILFRLLMVTIRRSEGGTVRSFIWCVCNKMGRERTRNFEDMSTVAGKGWTWMWFANTVGIHSVCLFYIFGEIHVQKHKQLNCAVLHYRLY